MPYSSSFIIWIFLSFFVGNDKPVDKDEDEEEESREVLSLLMAGKTGPGGETVTAEDLIKAANSSLPG